MYAAAQERKTRGIPGQRKKKQRCTRKKGGMHHAKKPKSEIKTFIPAEKMCIRDRYRGVAVFGYAGKNARCSYGAPVGRL